MKLSSKILLCYIITLVISGGIAMQIYYSGSTAQTQVERLTYQNIPDLEAISVMHTQIVEQERILYEYYATTNTDIMRVRLSRTQHSFEAAREELRKNHLNNRHLKEIST